MQTKNEQSKLSVGDNTKSKNIHQF